MTSADVVRRIRQLVNDDEAFYAIMPLVDWLSRNGYNAKPRPTITIAPVSPDVDFARIERLARGEAS